MIPLYPRYSRYQRTMRLSSKSSRLITRLWSICGPPQNTDWDPAKVAQATCEAQKFAKLSETSASLMGRLGIYLQRTQGFISGAFLAQERMPSLASRSSASGTSLVRHRRYAARRERSPVHVGQAGHKRDSGVFRDTRVLLPDFPSSQGIGWLEADSQPQGFQQICSAPILSYGDTANSYGLPRGGSSTTTEHLRTFEGLKS